MAKSEFKWHPKMQKLRTSIEKRLELQDIVVSSRTITYISSGSTIIDLQIGGTRTSDGSYVCPGWPRGRISEIYGKESSGKTTLALMACSQALKTNNNNGTCLYIDLEHAVTDSYGAKLGVDFRGPETGGTGRALRLAPRYAEEVEAIVNDACLQGIDMVVVDSVAGLQSKREIMRDSLNDKEKQGVAEIPRFMSNWMPKLQSIIATTGTHVMFTNQTRDKIGAFGFSEEAKRTTTGGNALRFWASLRLSLKPKMSAKAKRFNPLTREMEEVPIATDIAITNIKNKIDARQGHTSLVTLRYGVGIDEIRSILNVALAWGIVSKTKNSRKQEVFAFKLADKTIEAVGFEKFRAALNHNPEMYKGLQSLCTEKILEGMKTIDDEELASLAEESISVKMGGLEDDEDECADNSSPTIVTPEEMGVEDDGVDLGDI